MHGYANPARFLKFARPATGRSLCLLLPRANAELMGEALAEFARWADPGGTRVLVVLVDNAGGHVAGDLRVPDNVRLFHLPPCTPELQPAEPLWPLLREAVANEGFDEPDALEPVLVERCRWRIGQRIQVGVRQDRCVRLCETRRRAGRRAGQSAHHGQIQNEGISAWRCHLR